jgi:polar amino acid transport system substrate-binding protein
MKHFFRVLTAVCMLATLLASCVSRHAKGGSAEKAGYTSVDDLKNRRIAVMLGSVHDQYAKKNYPDATILQYKSPTDLVVAVKTGKADAAIYTYDELAEVLKQHTDLGLLGKPLFATPVAMGFHKGDDELRASFNRFLKQIRDNGVYDDMMQRWIKNGSTVMPDIPSAGKSTGTLVVGMVNDNGLPFTAVKDNKLVGFNIELLDRFAASIGKSVTCQNLEFGSLIAALESRKIDMIGTVMSVTDERKQNVDFSDPYYAQDVYAFTLKSNIISPGSSPAHEARLRMPAFLEGIIGSFQSNIVQENRWRLIIDGLWVTVIISFLSTIWGTVLGGFICFMRMSHVKPLELAAKFYISIMRGTPVLVVLMLIFYVVFASVNIDPVIVAVIAFGLNFGAYASEIYRAGIESIDRGQSEAGIAMGFTKVQTFRYIILPQTIIRILPVYKGEFISLVKMTSIVGYIAVQDLTKASDIIRSRTFDAFFPIIMVAVLYYLISWSLLLFIGHMEKTIDPRYKRRTVPQQA